MNLVKIKSDSEYLYVEIEEKEEFAESIDYIDSYLSGLEQFIGLNNATYMLALDGDIEESVLEFMHSLREEDESLAIKYDDKVSKNVENYRKRREDFEKFSIDARKIRDDREHEYSNLRGFEKSLKKIVRPLKWHQKLSAYHLAFARNACNFSVPGSGKTTVVYAAYNYLKSIGEVEKILVVGPLSSADAWSIEYENNFGEEPSFLRINGDTPASSLASIYRSEGPEVIHMTYQILEKFVETIKYLCAEYGVMMVLDEAHRVKNIEGQWFKPLEEIVSDMDSAPVSRAVLTGTPAPNGYQDIYNLYRVIWPKNDVIKFGPKQLQSMSRNKHKKSVEKAVDNLIDQISPYFIRIKKEDLGLPPAEPINPEDAIVATMDAAQRQIHDFFKDKLLTMDDRSKKGAALGARLIRLRQSASNPALLLERLTMDDIPVDESLDVVTEEIEPLVRSYTKERLPEKFNALIHLTKEIVGDGKKVLIWCEFIKTMEMLSESLRNEGVSNRLLNGSVSQEERSEVIEEFNESVSSFQAIIANPAAVGESISLHHQCHDAIYFEMSYNAGNYMQSKDRIHRLGLPPDTITRYHFVRSDAPIEEQIVQRVLKKEEAMIKLIDSEEIPLIANNKDWFSETDGDIRELLRAYGR